MLKKLGRIFEVLNRILQPSTASQDRRNVKTTKVSFFFILMDGIENRTKKVTKQSIVTQLGVVSR